MVAMTDTLAAPASHLLEVRHSRFLARAAAAIDALTPSDIRAEPGQGQSLTPVLAGVAVCLLTAWAAFAATRGLALP